ncbi:MAG: DUF4280 domain-containing protein [Lachnospiraceae bacterium]|nr:DUF4280 domain-containing protein [Lachnospiraceae bacterium]
MGIAVVAGATVKCPFGTAPASLLVTSQSTVLAEGKPVATIADTSAANIPTCGMCSSLANPQVASATAAALGVLTPQPCIPAIAGTWTAVQTKCIAGGKPCLTTGATALCSYGGTLNIINAGQKTVIM